jgi:hypothetical protein
MSDLTAASQRLLQAAILDSPGRARPEALAAVRGDNRLTAEARLGVYGRGYRARLVEALQSEFILLRAVIGADAFDLFATGYVEATPPRSYTLYDLGAGFADFLVRHRPPGQGEAAAVLAVPEALARIDRARSEVHRARGVETGAAVPPAGGEDRPFLLSLMGEPQLRPELCRRPGSLRLLALPVDPLGLVDAVDAGLPPPQPELGDCLVAVARSNYQVHVRRLEPWQFAFLSSLPAAPSPDPARPPPDPPAIEAEPPGPEALSEWLPVAARWGLVGVVEPPAQRGNSLEPIR